MYQINFLSQRRRTLSKTAQQDRKVFRWTVITFSVIFVVFLSLFSAKLYLGFRLKSITQERETVKKTILADEATEMAFLVFSNKLKFIREIFEMRQNKQQAISYFSNLFDEGVKVSGMTYLSDKGILTLQLTSESVFVLEEVFNILKRDDTTQQFKSVNKSGLSRNDSGEYTLSLTISLKQLNEVVQSTESQNLDSENG